MSHGFSDELPAIRMNLNYHKEMRMAESVWFKSILLFDEALRIVDELEADEYDEGKEVELWDNLYDKLALLRI